MVEIKLSEHFGFKKLLKFTFPTIIMMIFNSLYVLVDGVFISNFAGSDALAAVNILSPLVRIFSGVGFMIGTGGSALVSKTLGEERKEKAKKYFSILIYFEIIVGILLSIVGFLIVEPMAEILGAEGDILEYGVLYAKVLFISLTPYILQNSFQSFLIAAEKPKLGLIVSVVAGISNMFFDCLFIYLFKWDVVGAALATGISQWIGGLVPLIFFMMDNDTHYRLVKTRLSFYPIAKSCLNGVSEMFMTISISIISMLYNYQLLRISGYGGVVAYAIIQYVSCIFLNFFSGYSIGSIPIISFHYGARNMDEVMNLFKRGIIIIISSSFIIFGLTEFMAPLLAIIFVGSDDNLYKISVHAIRVYSILFLITGYNVFVSSFFTGLNNGVASGIISFSKNLIFELISILLLPVIFGINGVWVAVSFAEGMTLVITFILILLNRNRY